MGNTKKSELEMAIISEINKAVDQLNAVSAKKYVLEYFELVQEKTEPKQSFKKMLLKILLYDCTTILMVLLAIFLVIGGVFLMSQFFGRYTAILIPSFFTLHRIKDFLSAKLKDEL